MVSRAARTETGHIEDNAADGTFLGSGFWGRLLSYGTPIIISNGFPISTTAILAYGTITHNDDLRLTRLQKTIKDYRDY